MAPQLKIQNMSEGHALYKIQTSKLIMRLKMENDEPL
jgi:hypothetical protein